MTNSMLGVVLRTSLCCCVFGASSALAQSATYVVDDNGGPGVNFTDLPAAIGAAIDGDVIVVRAGSYSPFQLTEGLTILGESGANVRAGVAVLGLPTGLHAVISKLSLTDLIVQDCVGAVILDSVTINELHFLSAAQSQVEIRNCDDVRMHRTAIEAKGQLVGVPAGPSGVTIADSRVECSSCTVSGARGTGVPGTSQAHGGKGGIGIDCQSGARVHLALTSVFGGDGGWGCPNISVCVGGNGNLALLVGSGAEVLVAGVVGNEIRGGARGGGSLPGFPSQAAYILSGGSLRWSGAEFFTGGGSSAPIVAFSGANVQHVVPDDPTVEVIGDATPGAMLSVVLHGPLGVNGRLQQGSLPLVIDDGQADVARLTNRIRIHYLGPFATSGELKFPFGVPTTWQPGRLRFFQGLEIDGPTGGLIERANSVPIVVH